MASRLHHTFKPDPWEEDYVFLSVQDSPLLEKPNKGKYCYGCTNMLPDLEVVLRDTLGYVTGRKYYDYYTERDTNIPSLYV